MAHWSNVYNAKNAREIADYLEDSRTALATAGNDALERAARTGYRVCAETRHVTLGDKVEAAIRALKKETPNADK